MFHMLLYRDCSGDHEFVLDFMIFHRILNDVDGFSVTSSSDHIFLETVYGLFQ